MIYHKASCSRFGFCLTLHKSPARVVQSPRLSTVLTIRARFDSFSMFRSVVGRCKVNYALLRLMLSRFFVLKLRKHRIQGPQSAESLICWPSSASLTFFFIGQNRLVLRLATRREPSRISQHDSALRAGSSLNIISESRSPHTSSPRSSPQSLAAEKKSFTFSYPLLAQFAWRFLSVFFFPSCALSVWLPFRLGRPERLSLPQPLALRRCENRFAPTKKTQKFQLKAKRSEKSFSVKKNKKRPRKAKEDHEATWDF